MTCRCDCSQPREENKIAVLNYRAYLIDAGDHIFGVKLLDADDDVEALFKARALNVGCAVEIWDRTRRVIRLRQRYAKVSTPTI
ncbi:hypothetical protein [Methylobacterium sp. WSM2598]|uniref:hypothetical protein n=1 Tax=Methylobacterium sp. WSM2598 TaxID=398261 RepID=UPI00047567EE|nr:hypothetical protein [Methylobacterium sp. WSM2598]